MHKQCLYVVDIALAQRYPYSIFIIQLLTCMVHNDFLKQLTQSMHVYYSHHAEAKLIGLSVTGTLD